MMLCARPPFLPEPLTDELRNIWAAAAGLTLDADFYERYGSLAGLTGLLDRIISDEAGAAPGVVPARQLEELPGVNHTREYEREYEKDAPPRATARAARNQSWGATPYITPKTARSELDGATIGSSRSNGEFR